MSKTSFRSAIKEDKYNLKTFTIIFILMDISLLPTVITFQIYLEFFYFILYQVSLIITLLFGLRGHGKFRGMMMQLESVARNKKMHVDEREARLVSLIHHSCLELGYTYEERNKFQFNKKNKVQDNIVIKQTKKFINRMEEKPMNKLVLDEVVWKQIGYSLVGIWGLFGLVIAYWLSMLYIHWILILFLTGTWEIIDVFVLFYIHYIFKLDKDKFTKKQLAELVK